MENNVKAFFSEVLKNEVLQTQLDPIWNRYEDADDVYEAAEPLKQVIGLAGMHGFAFTAEDLDAVMNASLAKDFTAVQKGEIELSDADLDLVAAGFLGKGGGGRAPSPSPSPSPPFKEVLCVVARKRNPERYKKLCT